MNIAHLAAEVRPFARTGGLGEVIGALPIIQASLGHHVSVWAPLYQQVRREAEHLGIPLEWTIEPFSIELGYQTHNIGLLQSKLPGSNVSIYFVGADPFFDRPAIYSPDSYGRDDGLFRFAVFVRAALKAIPMLAPAPDIIHAHDWHTALAPMALAWDQPANPYYKDAVSVFTIHNLAFQGIYEQNQYLYLGLPIDKLAASSWREHINLLKGAAIAADALTTVSPSYAREITSHPWGFDLESVFRSRSDRLVGIINGVDRNEWNPSKDPRIPCHYGLENPSEKSHCRRALLTMAGMDPDDSGLVIGLVGRLTEQKGYDLVFPVLQELISQGFRFVLLGTGEPEFERQVRAYSHSARTKFWGYVGFEDTLAHWIEAGCDAFLMPSRFEPCGLSQLYSLAYGSLPIVNRVGGLRDTVEPFTGANVLTATGFELKSPTPSGLLETLNLVKVCFQNKLLWNQLVHNGMKKDFSWQRSAKEYLSLYQQQLYEKQARRPSSQIGW